MSYRNVLNNLTQGEQRNADKARSYDQDMIASERQRDLQRLNALQGFSRKLDQFVQDKYKSFSCDDCDFVIWKKIAGRSTSKSLAQVLLNKGKSQKLKGFKSKSGKRFSAVLILKEGKVEFDFK